MIVYHFDRRSVKPQLTARLRSFRSSRLAAIAALLLAAAAGLPLPGACAASAEPGSIHAWVSNYSGELGDGTFGTSRRTPVPVSGPTDAVAVSSGGSHCVALRRDGTVAAWGSNNLGQLGDGTSQNARITPITVSGLPAAAAVRAGPRADGTYRRDFGQSGCQ